MALTVGDMIKETTTTTGTGTVTLAGAASGHRPFSDIGNANTTYYKIDDNAGNWEIGVGTYTLIGTTLSRDTVLWTSDGNTTKINFAAGSKNVLCVFPATGTVPLTQLSGITTSQLSASAGIVDTQLASAYALLAGRSGGQTLVGGTGSGNNLDFNSTSHGTKGKVRMGGATGLVYDEVNNRIGVGIAAPSVALEVYGEIKVSPGGLDSYLTLNRTTTARTSIVFFQTGGSNDWYFGLSSSSYGNNADFHLYSYDLSADAITVRKATGRLGVYQNTPLAQIHAKAVDATTIAGIYQGAASRSVAVLKLTNSADASLGTVGGTVDNDFTDVASTSVDGTEDDLVSFTTVANTFAINGDSLHQIEHVQFVASATATRRLKKYFAGTLIFDSGALTLSLGGDFWLETTIIRESSTVVRCSVNVVTTSASSVPYATYTRITGLTLTGTNIIKATGIAAGVGAASADIVEKISKVFLRPAA